MDNREWEAARARYAAMSEAEVRALSARELIEAWMTSFPEPNAYAQAWYLQRPAQERLRMRMQSLEALLDVTIKIKDLDKEPASSDGALAIMELDLRARNAGYDTTGQWLKVEIDKKVLENAQGWLFALVKEPAK